MRPTKQLELYRQLHPAALPVDPQVRLPGPGLREEDSGTTNNSTAFVGPAPTVAGYNFSYWRKDFQNIGTDPAGVSVTVDGPTLVEAVFTPAGENRAPTIADDFSPSTESIILFAGRSQTFEAARNRSRQ